MNIFSKLINYLIKKRINKDYPNLVITITLDYIEEPCYWVTIYDKKVYYSEEYMKLVVDIKRALWKFNISNYYFVCHERRNNT